MNTLESNNATTPSTLLGNAAIASAPHKTSGFYDVLTQLTLQQKRARQQRHRAR
ncbi:MAG: hypothetical protein IBX52_03835 [Bacterioplanes sp.]|nr:hypothetical protein [Bacterioplanes sp.]